MALLDIQVFSKELGKMTRVRVLHNPAAEPPFPVLYLLHGLSDDESAWTRHTVLELHARRYPLLVVMPDGGRSFYADSALGRYESWIAGELVQYIDTVFQTRADRHHRAIAGLSMGGYGALKLALRHPDVFGAAAGHSSAVGFGHSADDRIDRIPEVRTILDSCPRQDCDLYRLAEACPAHNRPSLYLDCGTEDFLYEENETFHAHLEAKKVPHIYRRFPGEHNWEYWNQHIVDSLAFLSEALDIKPLA